VSGFVPYAALVVLMLNGCVVVMLGIAFVAGYWTERGLSSPVSLFRAMDRCAEAGERLARRRR
jgi:hypothetical protein